MSEPVRVAKAVRLVDGEYVDVPVDEECPYGITHPDGVRTCGCPEHGGTGRRLHDWATAFQPGDSILWAGQSGTIIATVNDGRVNVMIEDDTGPRARGWHTTGYVGGNYTADLALVLSDPSHRPEPMRWENP